MKTQKNGLCTSKESIPIINVIDDWVVPLPSISQSSCVDYETRAIYAIQELTLHLPLLSINLGAGSIYQLNAISLRDCVNYFTNWSISVLMFLQVSMK